MIAVFFCGLLLPGGLQRLFNSIELGATKLLITNVWIGFVLGGWVFGAGLFMAAKMICGYCESQPDTTHL
jgi:hypothetical protein